MTLIARSRWPFGSSLPRLVLIVVFGTLTIVAAWFNYVCPALITGLLAFVPAWVEFDRAMRWQCPHCGNRSLKTVVTGGIWHEDFREERVYWGECLICGKCAIRRGVLVRWTAYPDAEPDR